MDRQFKRSKKGAVQLTSLLDLLFVMIFVSLLQQKNVSPIEAPPKPVEKKKVVLETPKPTPTKYATSAIFHFYPTNGSQGGPGAGVSGKYQMEGVYNKKTGTLILDGVSWIGLVPKGYGMVPLSGEVQAGEKSFIGRFEFVGCKKFVLKRETIISGTPIAGVWKGSYRCGQGLTGLTLTIE